LTLADSEPAANPPQAIIFDIGRVIVRLNLARALAPLAAAWEDPGEADVQAKPAPEQIWAAIQSDPRWHDWQEGRMTPPQWHEHITARLHIRLGFTDFCAAWNRALDPQPILGPELFEKLGASCRLGLLSNTDPLHVEHIERHFSFAHHFPVRLYSCRVGLSKPNPSIYKAALQALDVPAASALYIDDIAEYAEAARQVGLDAIQFEGRAELIRELSRRGIAV
jgi:FMN phosphatase YigB (HAD superfamily)